MHNVLRPIGAAISVAAVLLVAACGGSVADQPSAGHSGKLAIVASFYPFQFIAESVARDHAVVSDLTQPGAEPHDLELTPRQVASLGEADLVIYEHGFQSAVDDAVQQSENPNTFDTSTVVPLQNIGTEPEEGKAKGAVFLDPHVWLDPVNVATIGTALAGKLSALDPANAADYTANAAALKGKLSELDAEFRTGLATCQRTQFITQHAAFGYLARRYGLTQIAVGGLSPDSEPSPSRIAEVQKDAVAAGVTTIFYETLVSPAVAQAIAEDLKLKTDVLDPIEGITATSRGRDYVAVMASNLASLKAAGGCR